MIYNYDHLGNTNNAINYERMSEWSEETRWCVETKWCAETKGCAEIKGCAENQDLSIFRFGVL
jgi:hypothetical protein